jgi:uncharacterized membrane protein
VFKKALIYRIYSLIIVYVIFYLLTRKITKAAEFTLIIEIVKLLQYYIFEKIWSKLK